MTFCKKCNDKYYTGSGIEYGDVKVCNHCKIEWDKYYSASMLIKYPDGRSWYNWVEINERNALFKEWIKLPEKGFIFR